MGTAGRELILLAFAFLFAYQLAMAVTLLITGERWMAYGLLFCLSVALRLLPAGAFGLVVLVLVYPLTYGRLTCDVCRNFHGAHSASTSPGSWLHHRGGCRWEAIRSAFRFSTLRRKTMLRRSVWPKGRRSACSQA